MADIAAPTPLLTTHRVLVPRHRLVVRLTHWINVLSLLFLLLERPADLQRPPGALLGPEVALRPAVAGDAAPQDAAASLTGVTQHRRRTASTPPACSAPPASRRRARRAAFPAWATIPSERFLAAGRRWHFFFAWVFVINGAIYLLTSLIGGHLRRDLLPDARASSSPATSCTRSSTTRGCSSPRARRRGATTCCRSCAYLGGRAAAAAADGAHRPDHVAGLRRRLPLAARPVRRPPVGALDPLHLRQR